MVYSYVIEFCKYPISWKMDENGASQMDGKVGGTPMGWKPPIWDKN